MAHDAKKGGTGPGRSTSEQLLEENRILAQRYLELEESTRKQLAKLRSANAMLTQGETHMRILLENTDIGFALLDLNLKVVTANQTLCTLLGRIPDELPGENFSNYVYVGKLPAFSRMTGQAANRSKRRESIELVAKDGRLVPCQAAVSDWLDDSGAVRGLFLLIFNVDDAIRDTARLKEMEQTIAENEKARTLFMDVVSRELRTPAGSIMGMVRMLMDAGLTERQAELAGVIHSSASSLVRLVDDIVDVVRVDSGELRLETAPLRPGDLAEGVANLFGVRAEEKGLELRVDVAATVPRTILGDAKKLLRVLAHFLDNAFKFTVRGRISLDVDLVGDSIRFMVSDTGPGIDPALRHDLLLDGINDSPAVRRHGGIGVGLAICRRLVGIMGGKIGFESDLGRGSEFHFTIPLAVPEESAEKEQELLPPPEAIRLAPMSLLLADANPLSSRVVRAYLQFDGHRLVMAETGMEAAEKCRSEDFDLIIVDLRLPKPDGLQTLRLIRDEEKATGRPRTPALILAASGQDVDENVCRRLGVDGVVHKPVQPVELMLAAAAATGLPPLSVSRQRAPGQYAAETSGGSIRRIDGVQLANLRQIMPEEQFLGILRFFMEDAVPGILQLPDMATKDEPDCERIAFAASKAAGLSGYLGLPSLADALRGLELSCQEADLGRLRELTGELPIVVEDTLEELKRILPEAFATISAMTKNRTAGDAESR